MYSGVEANEASSTLQLAETVQDAQITYFTMPPDPKKSQERFQCPYCPVVVSWKDSLKRHIFIKHSETQVFFACPTCDTKYTSRDSLRRHIKSKHASDGTMQLYKSKFNRKAPKRRNRVYVHSKMEQSTKEAEDRVEQDESTISALTLAVQQRLESYSRENRHKNCEPNTNSRIHVHPKETPSA